MHFLSHTSTIQMFHSQKWLVATILDNANREQVHQSRKFYQTALQWPPPSPSILPLIHSIPISLASWLILKHDKHVPASGCCSCSPFIPG